MKQVHARAPWLCLQELITDLIKRNPNYKPPPDYRPPKKTRKIFLPQPQAGSSINYMGLIIGAHACMHACMHVHTWLGMWALRLGLGTEAAVALFEQPLRCVGSSKGACHSRLAHARGDSTCGF